MNKTKQFGCHRTETKSSIYGRSMLEMLAVVALMGLLSFGGLTAYTFAMSKYRAIQISKEISLRAINIASDKSFVTYGIGSTITLPGFNKQVDNITYTQTKKTANEFTIAVNPMTTRLCKHLSGLDFPDVIERQINGVVTTDENGTSCVETNTMAFTYKAYVRGSGGSIGPTPPVDCTGNDDPCCGVVCSNNCQTCQNGRCLEILCENPNHTCLNGTCQCPGGTATGQNPQTCECPSGQEVCGGACVAKCDRSGMSGDRDADCNCKCLPGISSALCDCPPGSLYKDGVCKKFDCRGGPDKYYCYIDNLLCGAGCDSMARNCTNGICWADMCPAGSTFQKFVHPQPSGYCWGCAQGNWESLGIIYAYNNSWCCFKSKPNDFSETNVCVTGRCLPEDLNCAAYGAIVGKAYPTHNHTGCVFNDGKINKYGCYQGASGTWTCQTPSNETCGSNCTDPRTCGQCGQVCFGGAVYNEATQRCEKDGISCDINVQPKTCYIGDKRCGTHQRGNTNFADMSNGNCYDPGCAAVGYTFGYNEVIRYYGCISPDGDIFCHASGSYPSINCRYKGAHCAGYCQTYDVTQCGSIFLEGCSPIDAETGKTKCPFNSRVTETCVCTSDRTAPVGKLCCPPGQSIVNGGCTLESCPEGQAPDENGICKAVPAS